MAISTSTIFSTNTPAEAALVKESIFDVDASPKYAVGVQKTLSDGRVFRYAHFGADTAAGLLVAQDFSESGVVDTDDSIIAPASAQNVGDGGVGSKFVEMTLASATANQYAGGTLITTTGTGSGYSYKIKGNTATGDPTTGNIRIELVDEIQVALDATTDVCIIGSMYANLEGATATDSIIAGVSLTAMDVSEAAYGWIQVKGLASILADGAIGLGENCTLSDGTTGAVQLKDAETEPLVGFCCDASDGTAHAAIVINLG